VPLSMSDVFNGFHGIYFTYYTKLPVTIHRKLMKVSISYFEEPIYNVKFKDGIFGITKNGQIIDAINDVEPIVSIDFVKDLWNEGFANFFLVLNKYNYFSKIKYLEIYENNIAFFDKKDILIIMGNDNVERNFEEYLKILEMFSSKINEIKSIDLSYNNQAVIVWRGT
jgi:hypothetical protein